MFVSSAGLALLRLNLQGDSNGKQLRLSGWLPKAG